MISERALIESFKKIKNDMDQIRKEIKDISSSLKTKNNGNDLESIEKQIEKLNCAEEDLTESIKKESDSKKDNSEIKLEELNENLDLADSYY